MSGRVYLDWNATTPPHPDVLEAMQRAADDGWANPASVHSDGQRARAYLDRARAGVASLVGLHARDVTLTSGGTEANNLVLNSAFADGLPGGLVLGRIEHPSVMRAAETLERRGVSVGWVASPASGALSAEAFAEQLDGLGRHDGPGCRLVSLMAANHETGVLQPVAEVAELAHARGALLHVDVVQAVGKVSPELWAAADIVTVAAHKIRGPKGIGAIVTRPGLKLRPLLMGGAQERGIRPGTQSAALAAGFASAAERAAGMPPRYQALFDKREQFERRARALAKVHHLSVELNGTAARLSHVSNMSWEGWRGAELCAALDLEGIAVSSGAACSAGTAEPSAVITAMLGPLRASSAVRVSLGDETTDEELNRALAALERVLARRTEQATSIETTSTR
jgi:cysteine desulfurase